MAAEPSMPSIYQHLGITRVIHGAGTTTRYGGSLMRPETFETSRHSSATRPCGSLGIGGCDAFMKFCLSSSGCETRPAKGEPARAGSQPCDGGRNAIGDA